MSKTIKKFDRANVRQIQKEMGEALQAVADKYGLTLEQKRVTYYNDKMPVGYQLLVTETNEDGEVLDSAAKDLDKYAFRHGLGEGLYGREFTNGVATYRICGYKPKSRKYPILAEDIQTGKKFKFPVFTVKAGLLPKAA